MSAPVRGGPGPPNPLLTQFESVAGAREHRDRLIAKFGFAVPTDVALERIAHYSPSGIVEIGAGVGYWAWLLSKLGIDVTAYDIEPPPSKANTWHPDRTPWHPVERGGIDRVANHPRRTLMLAWPTRNEVWPADALELYANCGGSTLAYVGEPVGGRTGDDRFHAMLGGFDRCYACAYGITTSPCICGIETRWIQVDEVELPCWDGCTDRLVIYRRLDATDRPRRRWGRRV